ncbi:entry exclusion protein TrbK [Bosea sp. MMO-172]|uniref:entry exclusion protein TrbK n=1 Tax=Bosea sp. MMO-172 TaxID=3127885 RepID=UPI003FA59D01
MVRPPVRIIILCAGAAAAVGLWLSLRTPPDRAATDPAPAARPSKERERAKAFFGMPQKYDMDNGQEMRPRW